MENEKIIELPVNQRTITRRYTDKAVEFVTANKNKPFFLYLPHSMPHIPLFVPEDVLDPDPKNAYTCVIEHLDAEVGRLAQTVRDLDISDHTYIIFTSDNGPWITHKHHAGSAYPLRDGKATSFEGGQRVPCIMWGPGRIPAGTRSDTFTSTLDLLPSIAALTDSKLPADRPIDGFDITKSIISDAPSPRTEFIYYSARGNLEGLRQGDWKLLIKQPKARKSATKTSIPKPSILLFNLSDDVGETTNLAAKHPEKVKAMRARMKKLDDKLTSNARPVWRKK